MSHDPEAVEAIRDALAAVADGSGQEETVADALRDWLTDRADVFADALAAAGYTVTKSDAVAAEREACAGAVDEMCDDVDDPFMYGTLRAVAAAIRSRGGAVSETTVTVIAAVLADTTMGRHFLATYPVPRAARGHVNDAAEAIAEAVAAVIRGEAQ